MSANARSFRPTLEVLEDRRVPSSMARTLGYEVADGQLTLAQAVALGEVRFPPIAVMDFTPFGGVHGAGKVRFSITFEGNKRFVPWKSPEIEVDATTKADPVNARKVASDVFDSIPLSAVVDGKHTAGFDAVLDPVLPKITIRGYYNADGKRRDIGEPKALYEGGIKPKIIFRPAEKYPDGDTSMSTPTGKAVAFSFKPGPGHSSTLQEDTVVQGEIDEVAFSVNESAGESYLQVAGDVAAALTSAGLQGVQLDGKGDVVFMTDFAGQPVSELGITLVGSSTDGSPSSGIDFGVGSHRPLA
jgi:hypothetical protein